MPKNWSSGEREREEKERWETDKEGKKCHISGANEKKATKRTSGRGRTSEFWDIQNKRDRKGATKNGLVLGVGEQGSRQTKNMGKIGWEGVRAIGEGRAKRRPGKRSKKKPAQAAQKRKKKRERRADKAQRGRGLRDRGIGNGLGRAWTEKNPHSEKA